MLRPSTAGTDRHHIQSPDSNRSGLFYFNQHRTLKREGEDMRMKQNPDIWMSITLAAKALWPTLGASAISCAVCYARIIHDGERRKNKWVEGILCGLLAFSVSHGLAYLGLPDNSDVFVGGVIGFIGVEKIREVALRVLNKKTEKLSD